MQRQAVSLRFEPGQGVHFVFECADPSCYEIVMLSLDEDEVRAHPRRFLLVSGHEDAQERTLGNIAGGVGIVALLNYGQVGPDHNE
jgi:hypothetical protein